MTAKDILVLTINELRVFVKNLVSAENSKQLKRWIKANWEFFKPYLESLRYFSKDGLPSLRYKQVWANLALVIQRILKEQKVNLLVKGWKKMSKLELKIEYIRHLQIPIGNRKYTKQDLIMHLKSHHSDYSDLEVA
jgi:hypothetical protein